MSRTCTNAKPQVGITHFVEVFETCFAVLFTSYQYVLVPNGSNAQCDLPVIWAWVRNITDQSRIDASFSWVHIIKHKKK